MEDMEDSEDETFAEGLLETIYAGPRRMKRMPKQRMIGFSAPALEPEKESCCCCKCHRLKEKAMDYKFPAEKKKKADREKMTPKKMTKKLKEAK